MTFNNHFTHLYSVVAVLCANGPAFFDEDKPVAPKVHLKEKGEETSKKESCHENKNIDSHRHTATAQHLQAVPFLNS